MDCLNVISPVEGAKTLVEAAGFGSQQVITSAANGAVSVYAADIDGDGDMDALSASIFDDTTACSLHGQQE